MIWTKDGKVLVKPDGTVYDCDECPCGEKCATELAQLRAEAASWGATLTGPGVYLRMPLSATKFTWPTYAVWPAWTSIVVRDSYTTPTTGIPRGGVIRAVGCQCSRPSFSNSYRWFFLPYTGGCGCLDWQRLLVENADKTGIVEVHKGSNSVYYDGEKLNLFGENRATVALDELVVTVYDGSNYTLHSIPCRSGYCHEDDRPSSSKRSFTSPPLYMGGCELGVMKWDEWLNSRVTGYNFEASLWHGYRLGATSGHRCMFAKETGSFHYTIYGPNGSIWMDEDYPGSAPGYPYADTDGVACNARFGRDGQDFMPDFCGLSAYEYAEELIVKPLMEGIGGDHYTITAFNFNVQIVGYEVLYTDNGLLVRKGTGAATYVQSVAFEPLSYFKLDNYTPAELGTSFPFGETWRADEFPPCNCGGWAPPATINTTPED